MEIYLLSLQGCFKIKRLFERLLQKTVKSSDISSLRAVMRAMSPKTLSFLSSAG